MNGTNVLATARLNFGELSTLTLQDGDLLKWLNDAIREVYVSLPPEELRGTIKAESTAFSDGRFPIPNAWDRVLSVKDETGSWELHQVTPPIIQGMRELGDFFSPVMGCWAIVGNVLLVFPETSNELVVQYTTEPADITVPNLSDEITAVPKRFHTALVNLVTSYAYAQEEDAAQAQMYRGKALQSIASRGFVPEGEVAE